MGAQVCAKIDRTMTKNQVSNNDKYVNYTKQHKKKAQQL